MHFVLPNALMAQSEVHLGNYRFVPEQNVRPMVRGKINSLPMGISVEGKHSVLLQFSDLPNAKFREVLKNEGVTLSD